MNIFKEILVVSSEYKNKLRCNCAATRKINSVGDWMGLHVQS